MVLAANRGDTLPRRWDHAISSPRTRRPRSVGDCASRGIDDAHEYRGERLLAEHFLPAVVEPVRLHVEAKRYLCYAEDGYWDALSPASKRSLELQGGPFNAHQAEAFLCHDHAEDAVQLRRYDERGKDPALQTPDVAHFRPQLQANLLTSRTT